VEIAVAIKLEDYRTKLVIADGDVRGELLTRGWDAARPIELAVLQRPEIVRDVAEAFLDAGATVLTTNTASANRIAMAELIRSGEVTEKQIEELNRDGAAIARKAADGHPKGRSLVLGTIGPVEELLCLEEIEEEKLEAAYSIQAKHLAAGGCDAILCGSFTDLESLCAAVRAAHGGAGLPVIGSLKFDSGAQVNETSMGVTAPQACAALAAVSAECVGCEVGESPQSAIEVVSLMRKSTQSPIWVRLQAGMPNLVEGRVVYVETPAEFAVVCGKIVSAGANFMGGGAGAGTDHIAAVAAGSRTRQKP
jgi:methionine synthase I (cobalamin-dependent)